MSSEANHLAAFASRFLFALGMTTFNIPRAEQVLLRNGCQERGVQ
jgi:hypothetical protein